jgi:hypothetical protein
MHSILFLDLCEDPRREIELAAEYQDHYNYRIRQIHDECLELKPDCGGKIKLKFTIAPSGNITNVQHNKQP